MKNIIFSFIAVVILMAAGFGYYIYQSMPDCMWVTQMFEVGHSEKEKLKLFQVIEGGPEKVVSFRVYDSEVQIDECGLTNFESLYQYDLSEKEDFNLVRKITVKDGRLEVEFGTEVLRDGDLEVDWRL